MAKKDSIFVFPFEKLEVWQLAVDLSDYVLGLLERFPANKYIRLVTQMEAAVCSVAQNIAEGKGRQYNDYPKLLKRSDPQTQFSSSSSAPQTRCPSNAATLKRSAPRT